MVAQAVKRQEEGGGQTGVKAQGCLVGRLLGERAHNRVLLQVLVLVLVLVFVSVLVLVC